MSSKTNHNQQFLYNLYRPFLIAMMVCGFNFGFSKNTLTHIAFSLYSIFLIIIVSYANMTCCPSQEISFIWSLLEYVVFVIIMIFYRSKINIYFDRVVVLDSYLRVNRRHYYLTRKKILIGIIIIWMIGLSYTITYCFLHTQCYTTFEMFIIYELSLLALNMNRVWRYCLFEEIWRRLKLLRIRLQEFPESNVYLYVKDNKTIKENKIRFCLILYKHIADLLDLISPELNASLFISILSSIPKLIINVYRILLVINHTLPLMTLGFMVVHILQTSIFIFTPCIVVEMYRVEVERIRQYLMHQLFCEIDKQTKEDINLFLQYTSSRTFRYKVWRIIPMDLSLPLQIINLCTTYVIVVVNFTKVFDK